MSAGHLTSRFRARCQVPRAQLSCNLRLDWSAVHLTYDIRNSVNCFPWTNLILPCIFGASRTSLAHAGRS